MWIADDKLSLGAYTARYVEWLTQHGAKLFDFISFALSAAMTAFSAALLWFNPLILVLLFAGQNLWLTVDPWRRLVSAASVAALYKTAEAG